MTTPTKTRKLKERSQMERARAARAILSSEVSALHAFMAIFHPDISQDKVRELAADLKEQGKR